MTETEAKNIIKRINKLPSYSIYADCGRLVDVNDVIEIILDESEKKEQVNDN